MKIGDSVETIGAKAFYLCEYLKNISLAATLKTIGDFAFESCISLETIVFPNTLESIGESAFRYCTKLTKDRIIIPSSVKEIKSKAFYDCGELWILCYAEFDPYTWANDWVDKNAWCIFQ